MKCLDIERVKRAIAQLEVPTSKGFPPFVSPYNFLLLIGWDKGEYDVFVTKLDADCIEMPEDKKCFELIFQQVQKILAQIENMALRGKVSPAMCKIMLEAWSPIAYGSQRRKNSSQENIEKYKKIKELKNRNESIARF